MKLRLHWFIQFLGFSTLSLAGMFMGGQLGGIVAGAFACCAYLSVHGWVVPDLVYPFRAVYRAFRDDPRRRAGK